MKGPCIFAVLLITVVCGFRYAAAVDACTDNSDCNGQGTCGGTSPNKVCTCTNGYGGTTCTDAPKCNSDAMCLNGGNCTIAAGKQSVCACTGTGYTGDTCNTKSGAERVTFFAMSMLVSVVAGHFLLNPQL